MIVQYVLILRAKKVEVFCAFMSIFVQTKPLPGGSRIHARWEARSLGKDSKFPSSYPVYCLSATQCYPTSVLPFIAQCTVWVMRFISGSL